MVQFLIGIAAVALAIFVLLHLRRRAAGGSALRDKPPAADDANMHEGSPGGFENDSLGG